MENQILKVGIIGPKPFGVGGHDCNYLRSKIKDSITKILLDCSKEYTVVGITGLGIGVEQDFAEICYKNNIDYTVYLPYNEQEKYWCNLCPDLLKNYETLLEKALSVVELDRGKFSPKKIVTKRKKIANESDYIIYVKNHEINQLNDIIIRYLSKTDKTVLII